MARRAGPASAPAGWKRPATNVRWRDMVERLLAYSDRVTAAPGERIEIKVSAPEPGPYRARLIRLICGDDSPSGPGFKAEEIASPIARAYPGRLQPFRAGSHIEFRKGGPQLSGSFTMLAMVWP